MSAMLIKCWLPEIRSRPPEGQGLGAVELPPSPATPSRGAAIPTPLLDDDDDEYGC